MSPELCGDFLLPRLSPLRPRSCPNEAAILNEEFRASAEEIEHARRVVADFFLLFAAAEALVARLGAERRTPDEARAFNLAQALEIEAAAAGGPADCDPRYRAINRAF
jgi:hypothetical protein